MTTQKTNVAHGLFKRNVIFYKTLALSQLAFYYITNWEFDPASLAMIAVGYGVSASAAVALGVDRTYFGVELGTCMTLGSTQSTIGNIRLTLGNVRRRAR